MAFSFLYIQPYLLHRDTEHKMPIKRHRSIINDPSRCKSLYMKNKRRYSKVDRKKKKNVQSTKDSNGVTVVSNRNVASNLLSFASLGSAVASENSAALLGSTTDDPHAVDYEIFRNHEFPFENIVLEGGGIKGLAYGGALMVCRLCYVC